MDVAGMVMSRARVLAFRCQALRMRPSLEWNVACADCSGLGAGGAAEVDVDACQAAVEPLFRVAEHEVVLRGRGVGVPGFGEGGCAVGKLGAVAGGVGAGEHGEEDIGAVAVGEGADEVVEADVAGGDVVVVGVDVGDEVGEDGCAAVMRNQVGDEGHGVGGLAAGVVLVGVGVEEARVEGLFHGGGLGGVGGRVVGMVQESGDAGEGGEVFVVGGCCGEALRGELGLAGFAGADVVPVAEAVGKEVVGVLVYAGFEICGVALHGGVVGVEGVEVAVELEGGPRAEDDCRAPL